jgi:transcription termination factor 2
MMEREKDTDAAGGLLCDEMGLGKTWSIMGLLMNAPQKHTLLICPLAVIHQWVQAAVETGLGVYTVPNGSSWTKVYGSAGPRMPQLFIVNYDKFLFHPSLFKDREWHRVVCDEAHIIRNPNTTRYKGISKISSPIWWLLTGTPVVNKDTDLVSLLHIVNRKITTEKNYTKDKLADFMTTYSLQRTIDMVKDVLKSAPKKPDIIDHILPFETPEEGIFYRGIQGVLANQLEKLFANDASNMSAILLLLLRLRQISVHPQVYINAKRRELGSGYTRPDWTDESTKSKAINDLLTQEDSGCGWVVFCNFHDEISQLKSILEKNPSVASVITYDGSMNSTKREEAISETLIQRQKANKSGNGRHVVFLAQILCGATGLNLQHMNRVVFMSPWWTAALMDQAIGRVVRMGQLDTVVVHNICLQDEEAMNIDNFILEKVEAKRELCATLLNAADHRLTYGSSDSDTHIFFYCYL